MYRSIHEIPTYNYYKCEKGDLSYLGRGFLFTKFKDGYLRRKRFEEIKAQFGDTIKPDPVVIDKATKLNWLSVMQILAKSQLQISIFATDKQKAEILKLLRNVGLSFDHEDNVKRIQSFINLIKSSEGPQKANKEQTIDNLYDNTTFIKLVLQKDLNILTTPIAEFINNINASEKRANKNAK